MIGSWYRVLDGLVKGATKSSAMKKMLVDQVSMEHPTRDSTLGRNCSEPTSFSTKEPIPANHTGVVVDLTEMFFVTNR